MMKLTAQHYEILNQVRNASKGRTDYIGGMRRDFDDTLLDELVDNGYLQDSYAVILITNKGLAAFAQRTPLSTESE